MLLKNSNSTINVLFQSKLPYPTCFIGTFSSRFASTIEMDKIRARSLLKHTYIYNPPPDIIDTIMNLANLHGFNIKDTANWKSTEIIEMDKKEKLLLELGISLKHFVQNSKLHKMKTLNDLVEFYSTPVNNITKYAEMARNETQPKNLAILEHPRRFHPNDKSAPHGGITAMPGEGGTVVGIRNKRQYREFRPKKDWFDYEEENFNYDTNFSKGTSWDPDVARKMDSYADVRFTNNYLRKIK